MSTMEREPTRLQRLRMSWDDYLALPDDVRAEYVDGEVVVTPAATHGHNKTQRRVANAIESAIGLHVVTDAGWVAGTKARVPDVAVFAEVEDVALSTQVPVLVVEVLSPSTRTEDTVRKSVEYSDAGISQYWVVDRDHRTLTVFVAARGRWDLLLELDDEHPAGEVDVAGHGTVPLDLVALLAP